MPASAEIYQPTFTYRDTYCSTKSRLEFKLPTPFVTLVIKFPTPRDDQGVKWGGGGMLIL